MNHNFDLSLKEVLKHEGGFVNHPSDPGGATNKGITIAVFRKWVNRDGTVDDLKRITDSQVSAIYRKHYWNAVKADDLPSGIDYAVFDFAVNSGPSRAAKYLQAVLGVAQDGKIGPVTIKAAQEADPKVIINALCDRRLAFLKELKTWPTFGKGWSSRVSGVRSTALAMVGSYTPPEAPIDLPDDTPSTGHLGPKQPDDPGIVLEPLDPPKRSNSWMIGAVILIAVIIAIFVLFVPVGG